MPAATLSIPQELQASFAVTSSLLLVPRRTHSETVLIALESQTTREERVHLEEETFGQPFIAGTVARPSAQWESAEFNISETTGTIHPTPARPREKMTSDVRPYLTGNMLRFYRILLAIAQTKANTSRLAIEGVRTHVCKDPEENTRKFVLSVTIKANGAQAMAYWDALGRAVDTWREGLPEHVRRVLVSRWSFRVQWRADGWSQV